MKERLSGPLQESVLTLLAVNDNEGRIAAGMITSKVFDDEYQDLAHRILTFRKKHGGLPPGKNHLDDIVDDIIGSSKHKLQRSYIRALDNIISNADGLNAKYVLSRVDEFAKRQRYKAAILEAGQKYQQDSEEMSNEIEAIFRKAIKPDITPLDTGMFLNRSNALGFMTSTKADYFTGIPELDRVNCGPTYGTMLMIMGFKSAGKSWWCVDLGKRCLMQKARVLHITLEMSEDRVAQRYYQNLFAISKRSERFKVTEFELDELGRLEGFIRKSRKARMSLDSPKIDRYLHSKQTYHGKMLGRLCIKGFPAGSLTISKLESYLDLLEMREKFIPNVLIVDYPDLLHLDKKDHRISIGQNIIELRGLLQKRNLAGICPTQTNRKGWDAATVKGSMVGEDASKFMTADMVLTYSRTPMEKELGLARLYVEKNRDDEGEFTVCISQSYKTGQFVLNSTLMRNDYFDLLGVAEPTKDADGDEE